MFKVRSWDPLVGSADRSVCDAALVSDRSAVSNGQIAEKGAQTMLVDESNHSLRKLVQVEILAKRCYSE